MALRILAGVTFGATNSIEFEMEETTGLLKFKVRIDDNGVSYGGTPVDSGTRWAHEDMSGISSLGGYGKLATVLKTALEAGSVASGNSLTYTVTWSPVTLRYTFVASGGGLWGINFNAGAIPAEGVRARELLGFSSSQITGWLTSGVSSFYAITAAMGCKSNPTEVYEPDGVAEGGWTHGGSHFSVSVSEAMLFDDFDLYFESKAATYKQDATAAVPWTYQHFWEHVRAAEPFLVVDDVDSRVYYLRPDAARFKPERAVANWDGGFHLKLKCILEGYA